MRNFQVKFKKRWKSQGAIIEELNGGRRDGGKTSGRGQIAVFWLSYELGSISGFSKSGRLTG